MTLPPIHREILVDASPDSAFQLFTAKIGDWWPVASHSVFGAGATVSFEGETLVERSPDGEACEWGQVTNWLPPGEFSMTWHPGRETLVPSQVTVRFRPAGDQTLVILEHSGWDMFGDQAPEIRAEYDSGWPAVLGMYQDFATPEGPADGDGDGEATWVALIHRPGPAADPDVPVFGQPPFRQHVGFLQRMASEGYLVAAGPLTDEDGAGMTVLRLPGAGRLAEATRLATEEDASVACGFFTVTVRPWQVIMASPVPGARLVRRRAGDPRRA